MKCENCHYLNKKGAEVCVKCGSPLKSVDSNIVTDPNVTTLVETDLNKTTLVINPNATIISPIGDTLRPTEIVNPNKTIINGLSDRDCAATVIDNVGKTEIETDNNKLNRTIIEPVKQHRCPACSYPLGANTDVCPSCGRNCSDSSNDIYDNKTEPTTKSDVNKISRTIGDWSNLSENAFRLQAIDDEGEEGEILEFDAEEVFLNRDNIDANNGTIDGELQATIMCIAGNFSLINNSSRQSTFVSPSNYYHLKDGDLIRFGNRTFKFIKKG